MKKFKIGDKVRVVESNYIGSGKPDLDMIGTICEVKSIGYDYTVEFEHEMRFTHSCNGKCPNKNGRWYHEYNLELIGGNKIVITTDGVTTLARLYDGNKVIKRAEAKCSPEDNFDFNEGARIAFKRLIGEEKAETENLHIKPVTASL